MLVRDNTPDSVKLRALLDLQARLDAELGRRQENAARMREIAERAAEVRERCRTFSGFVKESWHIPEPGVTYKHNWHIDAIGEHLQAVHDKEIQRLQVNMPPGFMKSTTVGVMFPAWEWGPLGTPWLRYFTTSYEAGYARRDSRKHRDLVASEWFQALWPEVTLVRTAEENFSNTALGGRVAVPFSRLTAGRGNRLIIDDPHSTEKAESDVDREKTTRLFRESATSRLNDPETDAIIVMMQRLHPKDLCGVIEQLNLPYVKLILPMEYMRSRTVTTKWFTDPRTEELELLHPERTGKEAAEALKVELGQHAWDTQYLQASKARDGSYFFSQADILDKVRNTDELAPAAWPTKCDAIITVMDTATKTGKKRDGTGSMWFALTMLPKPKAVVLDWDMRQVDAALLITWLPTVVKRAEEFARQCGARMGSLPIFIEDKDSGQILIQQAHQQKIKVMPIDGPIVAMGKEGRALSAGGYVRKGMVKFTGAAYDKTDQYKGRSANHAVEQITEFQVGKGTPLDEDELFDTFCYGTLAMFGEKQKKKST